MLLCLCLVLSSFLVALVSAQGHPPHPPPPPPVSCFNGEVYPDRNLCECYSCWEGSTCDTLNHDCLISCETNEGYVQDEYWTNVVHGRPQTDVTSSYRTDYLDPEVWNPGDPDPPNGIFGALREEIIRVHELVGNVDNIRGKSLVLAHGATHLMNAAIDAYSNSVGQSLEIVASRPYYYLIPGVARVAAGATGFEPSDTISPGITSGKGYMEIITVPRNPDGAMNSTPTSPASSLLYDNVFLWPSFVDQDSITPLDDDMNVFSLSKLAGLSGCRLGWAFVKDADIANGMGDYIYYSTHGITVDAQYRAYNVLKQIADDQGQMFQYVKDQLASRWDWSVAAFANNSHYVIAGAHGFPVMWVNCLDFNGTEGCVSTFEAVGIEVRDGGEFGTPGYVRLNMMVHSITWSEVQKRLTVLLESTSQRMLKLVENAKKTKHIRPRYSS
mmetsp:Transcript_32146/g.44051  ORF Transcript_32146/g.44051 Transcript_32146/m.44051 type:complete len:442 (-) Transcript_32146:54-1379(-)|eukprot:CAMPEP_0201489654 /NCGR_PEP_ID=MMETSP0151_2-20130828/23168_1 /ASSEMBLY_ACC=CAM_ASM_000257 /TAXON_ID=200890 /ORGANISM="Paramoeba atlantica, Strain 621/1 / CCAP 1560/9" /LENGTH=441 /DNA_ID=CAMNT_0047875315 /DNA_START=6 /DNA_END=1331 /DNA_ORIENTATION=+